MGVKVTGLDASSTLLSEAKKLAQEMGLAVEWVLGDTREIPFERQFDAVVSLDAFGFFEDERDNKKAVNEMVKALKPGARLLIAVVNGTAIIDNFKSTDQEEREGLTIKISRTLCPERKAMKEQMRFIDKNGESSYERYQRLFSVEELSELVTKAGLKVTDVTGSIPFTPVSPEKIVLLANKPY
jgi:2-polyprenyl-3-methyl-5-hydroxy-6-metoxy-1,4-benzoquinol methylase